MYSNLHIIIGKIDIAQFMIYSSIAYLDKMESKITIFDQMLRGRTLFLMSIYDTFPCLLLSLNIITLYTLSKSPIKDPSLPLKGDSLVKVSLYVKQVLCLT